MNQKVSFQLLLGAAVVAFFIVGVLRSYQSSTPSGVSDPNRITREQFGSEWPLTVNEAELGCSDIGGVILTANGKTYAVNGTSISEKNADGQPKYSDLHEIWANNSEGNGVKQGIGPILDKGLNACK